MNRMAENSLISTPSDWLIGACIVVLTCIALRIIAAKAPHLWSYIPWLILTRVVVFVAWLALLQYYVDRFGGLDATAYHDGAVLVSDQLNKGEWYNINVRLGTDALPIATGVLYWVIGPSLPIMFVFAGALSATAPALYYYAVSMVAGGRALKAWALFIMWWPSVVLWSSLYGKDCVVHFGLSSTAVALARYGRGYLRSAVTFGVAGIALVFVARPHIGLIAIVSVLAAVLIGSTPAGGGRSTIRRAAIFGTVGVFLAATPIVFKYFEFYTTKPLIGIFNDIIMRTTTGASAIEIPLLTSPLDLPSLWLRGFVSTLFRPFPWEAHSFLALVTAVENTVFMAIVAFAVPGLLKHRIPSRTPLFVFSAVFVLLCVLLYSMTANLGALARWRIQYSPFLVVILLAPYLRSPEPQKGDHGDL